jgi:hypothetical protein
MPSQTAVLDSEDPNVGSNMRARLSLEQVIDGQKLKFVGMVKKEMKELGIKNGELGVAITNWSALTDHSHRAIAWADHFVSGQSITGIHFLGV